MMPASSAGSPARPLVLLTAIFCATFSGRIVFAPLPSEIETGLALTHTAAVANSRNNGNVS
jgi:hypothetical protein